MSLDFYDRSMAKLRIVGIILMTIVAVASFIYEVGTVVEDCSCPAGSTAHKVKGAIGYECICSIEKKP